MFPAFFDEIFERIAVDASEIYHKPAANIKEDDISYCVELATPGFNKEEINMKLEKNILTISAGHNKDMADSEVHYSKNEFGGAYKYRRSFILPETINMEGIKAEYHDGVLHVDLPKKDVKPMLNKEISIL